MATKIICWSLSLAAFGLASVVEYVAAVRAYSEYPLFDALFFNAVLFVLCGVWVAAMRRTP